jgi:excisionase family DNA binding protein
MRTDAQRYRFTAAEAAAYLDLPIKTLYRKASRGEIDHLRTGPDGKSGLFKFSEAGLEAWIAGHRQRAFATTSADSTQAPAPSLADVMPAKRVFS